MRLITRTNLITLLGLLTSPLFSQNILLTYQKSDALFVCGTDTFFVSVQNLGTQPLSGATLQTALPVGVDYLPGSVTGATEQNISSLAQPLFALPAVAPGATAKVAVLLTANCAAAAALDAGQLFIAQLTVQSPTGNASVTTTNFTVETGLLLIESVQNLLMSGEKGDTLLRKICVRNTRLGKIGSLHFEDEHAAGFEVSISNAGSQSGDTTFFQADFGSNFFTAFGDGDNWLELGETACFTEKIIITDCGIPEFTNNSLLRAGFGCGGEICRYDSVVAGIQIRESTKVPDLAISPIWTAPVDYCGSTPVVLGLKIVNLGKADATDVFVKIDVITDLVGKTGIGPNSFRLVHNGISTPLAPNLASGGTLAGCGKPVTQNTSLVVPFVAARDSLLLLFDNYTCESSCNQVLPTYGVEYFYRKPCPENGFVSDTLYIFPDGEYNVNSFIGFKAGECLKYGESYPFEYTVVSKRLVEDAGYIHLNLDLPHGLTLDDSCVVLLGGEAPGLLTQTPSADGGVTVHLAWELPLPNDSLDMSFCLHYECDSTVACLEDLPLPGGGAVIYSADCQVSCFLQLSSQTYWTPDLNTPYECAIGDCDSLRMAVNIGGCKYEPGDPQDTIFLPDIIYPLPGLKKWFSVYRLNYGLQDNDDNRQADNGANSPVAAAAGVRRDRFLPGDTLRVEYCGTVDSGGGLYQFGRTIWHEVVNSDKGGSSGTDLFQTTAATNSFSNKDYFRFVRDSIHIRYADGTEYGCPLDDLVHNDDQNYFTVNQINTWPPKSIDDFSSQRFRLVFSLENLHQAGCLPKGTLDMGDSIFLYTDFKINLNFKPASSNLPDPPLVAFRTAVSEGGLIYAYNQQPFKKLQYSGIRTERTPNQHSIKSCENSVEAKKFRYLLHIARPNLFPFEVRPIAEIVDYYQTVPDGLQAASAKLEYLVLQDSVPKISNVNLPYTEAPGQLLLDFSPAFDDPVDEGFTLRTSLQFKPDCQYNHPDSSRQYFKLQYTTCFGPVCAPADSVINGLGFFSNAADLRLESDDTLVISKSKIFDVDFILKNYVVSPAFNAWVKVVSLSGQAGNFVLLNGQNQPVPLNNGIFTGPTVNGLSDQKFRLTGTNISCFPDTLMLIYGWNCTPLTSLDDAACDRDTFYVELRLEKPELELEVVQEPPFITVCDTSGYFEFVVYNAKTGYAYDPFATIKLPPGLFLVPGSCQISYPAGSTWTNIPDPQDLSSNLFQWDLAAIQAAIAANGIPGVDQDPQNAARIRFRTYTECGFVSNTQVIYGARGTEPCGLSTNVLNKPGELLKVNGLNTTYGVIASLQPNGMPAQYCGGNQVFSAQLTLLGTPLAGDSIYILLPQGVTYVPGSYLALQNAPTGPPTPDGTGFRLPLPAGLAAGSTLEFNFSLTFDQSAGCIDQIVTLQTRVRTEVFCAAIGAPCTVYAATGEASWKLNLQHPQFVLGSVGGSAGANGLAISATVRNIGLVPASEGITVQLWRDVDGNGVVSAGDVQLQTVTDTDPLDAGDSTILYTVLNLDPAELCGLLVVLPASENCACNDQVLPLDNLSIKYEQSYCLLAPVDVGVTPQPGFTYQWLTPNGLACQICATTTFTPPANLPPGVPTSVLLREQSANCTIHYLFVLTFGTPAISVSASDQVICKGDNTTLTVLPSGQTYQWSPVGSNDPALQQQTVAPNTSTTYSVTVTFDNNCTQTATATVTVFLPDTTLLSGLVTCQGEPTDVLGNVTDVAGLYSLRLTNIHGCDSILYQNLAVLPRPSTAENLSFCRGDTLYLLTFDTVLTETGQVCRTYTAANGCDSLHCVNATTFDLPALSDPDTLIATPGQPVILTGPGGYVTYTWIPGNPDCPNCPDLTVTADTGFLEYKLIVTDANGCEGQVVYRVLFFPPCDAQRLLIPNAFTPNDDGINDVFRVVPYEGLEVIGSLTIYDRWGEKVYENFGNVSWDGTIDGKPGPMDVYAYRIDIICDGEPKAVWGDVSLLR